MELESSTKGFLPPRLTLAQQNMIADSAVGLIIWYTDCNATGAMQFYNGITWVSALIASAPTVTTDYPFFSGNTAAIVVGSITSENGFTITARGVCYSTVTARTVANSKTTETGTVGTFSTNLVGLTANTLYYARAYVTGNGGSFYGNQITFTTPAI